MVKFLRNYILSIERENTGQFITVRPPITIEFDINRANLSSSNQAKIRIFNLSENNRNQILYNQYWGDFGRTIMLSAGYGDGPGFPLIFSGRIQRAWSIREGTNFVTQIEALDIGTRDTNLKTPLPPFQAGTSYQQIINILLDQLAANFKIKKGVVGDFPGVAKDGYSVKGSLIDELYSLTNGGFFIDNGVANCLNTLSEVLAPGQGNSNVINAESGLIGTPELQFTLLTLNLIFEPGLRVGQWVEIKSSTGKVFNSRRKITSIHHKGTISHSVAGEAITNLGMLYLKDATEVS